jgi:hypothetical protein
MDYLLKSRERWGAHCLSHCQSLTICLSSNVVADAKDLKVRFADIGCGFGGLIGV